MYVLSFTVRFIFFYFSIVLHTCLSVSLYSRRLFPSLPVIKHLFFLGSARQKFWVVEVLLVPLRLLLLLRPFASFVQDKPVKFLVQWVVPEVKAKSSFLADFVLVEAVDWVSNHKAVISCNSLGVLLVLVSLSLNNNSEFSFNGSKDSFNSNKGVGRLDLRMPALRLPLTSSCLCLFLVWNGELINLQWADLASANLSLCNNNKRRCSLKWMFLIWH